MAAVVSGVLPSPCYDPAWEVTVQGLTREVAIRSAERPDEMACIQVEESFTAQVEWATISTSVTARSS